MTPHLICTDLDRTLLPNGDAPESPGARERLAKIVSRHDVALAFVTGRHLGLVREAITEYDLPQPRYAICDVGTSIYEFGGAGWTRLESWWSQRSKEWPDTDAALDTLSGFEAVTMQEPERQAPYKLSWYAPPLDEVAPFLERVYHHLAGFPARIVYSVDEATNTGLLDLIPLGAGKLAAIEHLLDCTGIAPESTLFAGDSGNDLDVLASRIPAVLVANATDSVRADAIERTEVEGLGARLYTARGDFEGMNGNYAAGILEGLAHFWPDTLDWMR